MADFGKFLAIEGIDGSGKSTQLKRIVARLIEAGMDTAATFEPTDGPVGSLIRQMLEGRVETDQRTIAALFAADRTDHLVKRPDGVRAMLERGRVVVCDRYYFSSYAYHSLYTDLDWVIALNSQNARILRPCATLFIDVDPDVCLERIAANRSGFDMYEKIDILKQVRQNYFNAFQLLKNEENVVIVDGNGTRDQVAERLWQTVAGILPKGPIK